MNILEIARKCNADLTTFDGEPLAYTFAIENLYKFSDLVILQHFIDNESQQEITTLTNEITKLQLDNEKLNAEKNDINSGTEKHFQIEDEE